MAHYRKVETLIWNDRKFNALSSDGKLVFLFLLTHPNLTVLGAMRSSVMGLAGELQWLFDRLKRHCVNYWKLKCGMKLARRLLDYRIFLNIIHLNRPI